MSGNFEETDPGPGERLAYLELLRRARGLAGRSVGRLRDLAERYPDAVPGGLVEHLMRASEDRRAAIRLPGPGRAAMREPGGRSARALGTDRSRGWLGLRLSQPKPVGCVLLVRPPGGGPWLRVEVRHCRSVAGGWVAGCLVLGSDTRG